jgi:carbonic anhydrase/acetyltransferase-like protein (isoleucine patch superfamily)
MIKYLTTLLCLAMLLCISRQIFAQVVPAIGPFYAGEEQTDDRMIYVGGGDLGGRLAVDCHADFSVARDDNNVALNWSNLGTFKWTFGFYSFDGPISEYPSFNPNVGGSTAVTFDGGDKLRMILEPGFGYTLPSEITDGVLSIELWVMNPSIETGETLIRFEDGSNVDLTASQFNMSGSTSWQHLVAVSNGTETSYYLNGSHVATQAGAINFSGNAVINLGAQSFSGSIAAVRIHTEQMNTTSISHNYDGGVGLGTYLFYPIEAEWQNSCFDFHGDANIYTGDPTACDLISWRESAHFRSMWWHDDPLNNEIDTEEEIGDEIEALQLPKLEAMYTYLNEKSGKHLPHVSNNVLNRGDGRKYKWIVGNTWGGGGSGWSILQLGHGAMYITTVNPHEYIHGTDNHQSTHVTSQWFETHANFQVSWLGDAQVNPVDACPEDAHIYPSYGGNYYHDYLIWDHLVETPEFTGLYVTRMWNRGDAAGRYPPQNMEDMDPSPDTPFNEEWVKCAAKNITWDYDNHPEYAENWASQEDKAHRHFTLLEPVPYLSAGWYEPQKWRAPQQHGYNLCALEPNQGTVTADLTGHIDSERGSAWSAMFVAVGGGTPRYGDVFTNGTQGSFNVLSGDDELYLVVVATPSNIMEIGIFSDPFDDYITDYRGDNKARFPYQVLLGGTTPRPDQWRPTPGIDPSATVDETVYVSPNAYVGPNANILGNARVEDYAVVEADATIRDNAVVSGYAIVKNNAIIRDDARVTDFARIEPSTIVENAAHVMEHARVSSDRQISDNAVIKGSAYNKGNISGTAIIDGNYLKNGDHSLGYQFLWAWGDYLGDGEWYQEFYQLLLEYKFEQQNGYRVWDTHGATWGRLVNGPTYVSDNGSTALDLDGNDDFVELYQSVGQFEEVTIEVDVKWDGGAKGQKLINFSNSTTGDEAWLSPSDSQGKLAFSITVGVITQIVRASNPLPSGSWKNVKLVTYGDNAEIYIDDIIWASSSSITHNIDEISANECYIGRGASGGNLGGRIDDFTVWTKALDVTAGIDENFSITSDYSVFPNPAVDIININAPDNLNYEATIFDLQGRLIISTINQSVIDVQTLPQGMYLIVIKDLDSGQKVIEKIIKR